MSPELATCFEQGLARMEAQDWPAARAAFTRGLALDASRRGLWHNRAWCQLQLGDLAAAQADLESLLQLEPDHAPGLALLGRVRLAQGDTLRGAALLARSHEADPQDGEIARQGLRACLLLPGAEAEAVGLAQRLAARGQLDEASGQDLHRVLILAEGGPDLLRRCWTGLCQSPQAPAWMFEAWTGVCCAQGLWHEAAVAAALWMAGHPHSLPARRHLLDALTHLGDLQAALAQVMPLLHRQPDEVAAMAGLVQLLWTMTTPGSGQAAALVLCRLQDIHPRDPGVWVLEGRLLESETESARALACFRRALDLDPLHLVARCGAARALAVQGRHAEALHELAQARGEDTTLLQSTASFVLGLQACPQRAEAALRAGLARGHNAELARNLGFVLLAQGRYAEGFELTALRLHPDAKMVTWHQALARGARPWSGDLAEARGRRLLVIQECGFGDAFQFTRVLPWLQDRGVQVLLCVHPGAASLLASLHPGIRVIEGGQPLPEAELMCEVQDLPGLLQLRLEDIGRCGGAHCLKVDAAQQEAMARRLGPRRGLRVALAWRSSGVGQIQRDLGLHQVAELGLPGVEWFSLQYGPLWDEEAGPAARLGLRHEGWSFSESAAALLHMDAVVSVDTAYCHLAGALGLPAWILLPQAAEWRWGPDGDTTPWYPRARLFRQTVFGDWREPLARVADLLRDQVSTASAAGCPAPG